MQESIVVDTADRRAVVNRNIYAHFSEHLGHCIYGGFYVGKDSPIPNKNGVRQDVVEAFREIDIPTLRWPGGCFADEYHWRDGIGPLSERKRMINTNWGDVVEDNSFGTHEFFDLCDQLGCEPYICGNVGSGSVREMDEWIEYMTFAGDSPMSRLRAANGRKEPWKLPYFGIGNENWGGGGNMRPEYYADQFRRYQTFVRQYDKKKPKIFKIAGGANVDDYEWTDVLMDYAAKYMDGLSLHYYTYEYCFENKRSATVFDEEGWYRTMKNSFRMDELLRRHSEIMDEYDEEKRIALVVDEWGCWHKCEEGTNPGFLYQQNTMRDAVVAGMHFNIFHGHADRVRMANIAQAVNVLQSPVLTSGEKMILTPTWYVFHMYKGHQGATSLGTTVSCASAGVFDKGIVVPSISASATVKSTGEDANGKAHYLVTMVNTEYRGADKEVTVSLAHLPRAIESATAKALVGEAPNAMNTFDNPNNIAEKAAEVKVTGRDSVAITLPPYSVAAVEIVA